MTKEELLARLGQIEWRDIEFKEAHSAVPKSAYETVSAFANTWGGWLVSGVREAGRGFEFSSPPGRPSCCLEQHLPCARCCPVPPWMCGEFPPPCTTLSRRCGGWTGSSSRKT